MTPAPAPRAPGIRWWALILAAAAIGGVMAFSLSRIHVDADIAGTIPESDPVLADARRVMTRGAALDKVAIHIWLTGEGAGDPDRLVDAAGWLSGRLRESGLFSRVGLGLDGSAAGQLYGLVLDNLPALFTEEQLRSQVAPLVEPGAVRAALERDLRQLGELQGTGQAEAMAKDPLGLRDLVLQRLSRLMPAGQVRLHRGQVLSADGRHLLLLATPAHPGSDTAFARRLDALLTGLQRRLPESAAGRGTRMDTDGG